MRILVVTPWFPTDRSPASGLFVAREAHALAEAHDVHVLHLDWTGASDAETAAVGLDVSRVSLRRTRPADFARARRLVREAAAGADVVHTHALTGLLPWLRGRPADRPWVHSEHWSGLTAPETLGVGERMLLRPLRRVLARPEAVIAESRRLAAAIRPHRHGTVEIVPCVVPAAPAVAWPQGDRLLAVGGLIPRKGPLLAVGALAALIARGRPATLTWIGEGPERESAHAEAERLGVSGALRLTGALPSADVERAFAEARLFVLPTQGDNFCVATAEALTHGRPIVSGAATGAVDYSHPSVSRFVDVQTPRAYADAIEDLLTATSAMTPHDVSATVADAFTPTTVREGIERVYRSIGVPA
ncbi:hypothetical protein GCM10009775_18440 [Microbacterium aoyamense]|uniref:Glycosyltransferase subfamily 4-like N-terminal domain-containing protein n=1 Tax=Microbacterium aoyamense TaxID=344166 RepID=A0ABP5AZC7_9MICO|nr:glycosyltransferase family 4 protein [Microbacterium aoyamense]